MALVICAVFFTDLIRRRMSRVLGMLESGAGQATGYPPIAGS